MKRSMLAMLVALAGALPAQADGTEEQIDIVGDSFFPPLVIVSPGDVIVFTNRDGVTDKLVASDGSWETPVLAPGDSARITVTADMGRRFGFANTPTELVGTIALAVPEGESAN
ncbi:MAG: hypothetical protein D6832_00920 [Alphaproteobacteria bacterium]|nr:MAG: hypothetical protein D6832_00920 [Alphaproteobacteria bacterium]